jgi:hypothetical protein
MNIVVGFVSTRPTLRALLIRIFQYLPKRLSDAIIRRRLYQVAATSNMQGSRSAVPESADWIFGALSRPRSR